MNTYRVIGSGEAGSYEIVRSDNLVIDTGLTLVDAEDRCAALNQNASLKIYVAGPMTGYPEHNFPAFHAAAAHLRGLGHEVISPAEMSEPQESKTWADWMRRDIAIIAGVDAVAVLPCWEQSKGARLETHIARELGLPILDAQTLEPVVTMAQDLESVLADVARWAHDTFPSSTASAKVNHLFREACELFVKPHDGEEMADMVMIVSHLAAHQGISLKDEISSKLAKNRLRKWGKPDTEGVVSHVREEHAGPTQFAWACDATDDDYTGGFDSVEAALSGAIEVMGDDTTGVYIGSVRYPDPDLSVGADRLLEWHFDIDDDLSRGYQDSGCRFNETAEQRAELDFLLRTVFAAWKAKHELTPARFIVENPKFYPIRKDEVAA